MKVKEINKENKNVTTNKERENCSYQCREIKEGRKVRGAHQLQVLVSHVGG